MKKNGYSIRGIIANEPRYIKDFFSHKTILIFCLVYESFNNGNKIKNYRTIIIKDKMITLKVNRDKKELSYMDLTKSVIHKGDIFKFSGYDTKIKTIETPKPIACFNAVKFKALWSNHILERMINNEIACYNYIEHGESDNEQTKKEIDKKINRFKKMGEYNPSYLMFSNNVKIKTKRKKPKNDKSYILYMSINKSLAQDYYKKGDKYKALAKMGLNRYIYNNDLTEKIKRDNQERLKDLITANFKDNTPYKPIHY